MEKTSVTTASPEPSQQHTSELSQDAVANEQPGAPAQPSTGYLQLDSALEYESMVLLSKIEQLGIRMNEPQVQGSTVLALEHLVTITNHLVEFIEQLPMAAGKRFALDKLIARDWSNYTHLRAQHIRNRRLTIEAFKELQTPQSGRWDTAIFRQVAEDLLRVHNICLNICVKAFHAPDMRQQWSTIYSGFLVHLVKVTKSVEIAEPR